MQDTPGVGRRERSDSSTRNWRDPPRLPTLGEGAAYKRNVKGQGAGREAEGPIVLTTLGENRAEGEGPALVALGCGGKGEGMA